MKKQIHVLCRVALPPREQAEARARLPLGHL